MLGWKVFGFSTPPGHILCAVRIVCDLFAFSRAF
jgi:hypothetical protein